MIKQEAITLFKKLYVNESRTKRNWRELLNSLEKTNDITERQVHKWFYFGTQPYIIKKAKTMAARKKARTEKQKANDKKLGLAAKRRAAAKRKTNPVKKKAVAKKKAPAKKKKAVVTKKKATAKKKAPEKKTKVYKKNVPAKRGSIIVGLSDLRADKTYKDFMYYTAVGAIKNAWDKSIQEAAMWTTHAKAQKASKALIKNFPQNTAFFVVTQNASKANVEEIITRYGYERRSARKK